MTAKQIAGALALVLGTCGSGEASLIGDTITVQWVIVNTTAGSGLLATETPVVGSGIEIDCPTQGVYPSFCFQFGGVPSFLDIGASTIRFEENLLVPPSTGYAPGDFNGWIFSGLDTGTPGGILGVAVATNIPGFDSSRVSFTADSVSINMQGLGGTALPHQFAEVSLFTESVPEPATVLLTAIGILATLLGCWGSPASRVRSSRQCR